VAGSAPYSLVASYSYLYDLPTEGQDTLRPDERSHLLSVDWLYDLGMHVGAGAGAPAGRWELGGRLAARYGARREARDAGPWQDFGLRLASLRARYHLTREWDALAEYRWLSDVDGASTQDGALVGAYYHVGDNFEIGAGYNFTDYGDDLRQDGYRNGGWFLDLIGKW